MNVRTVILMIALMYSGLVAAVDEPYRVTHRVKGDFDEIRENLEMAITNRGMLVSYKSHVGKMLIRTADAVGATKVIYTKAMVILFCSAALSREVMEADPDAVLFCPYKIALYELPEKPGEIILGYQRYSLTGSSKAKNALIKVEKLLEELMLEAAE